MLKALFVQETKEGAEKQWHTVADVLREKNAKLAGMMDAVREDGLAYMDVPQGALAADIQHYSCRDID